MLPLESCGRYPDWPERLAAVIADHQAQPFQWGRYDCATLWIEAVAAMTGYDAAQDFARWRSEKGALKALRQRGFASVRDVVAAIAPEIPAAQAGRGDLAFPAEAWQGPLTSPAVLTGSHAVSRTAERWVSLPRARLVTFFRV